MFNIYEIKFRNCAKYPRKRSLFTQKMIIVVQKTQKNVFIKKFFIHKTASDKSLSFQQRDLVRIVSGTNQETLSGLPETRTDILPERKNDKGEILSG